MQLDCQQEVSDSRSAEMAMVMTRSFVLAFWCACLCVCVVCVLGVHVLGPVLEQRRSMEPARCSLPSFWRF
jgi:hypothetical protein